MNKNNLFIMRGLICCFFILMAGCASSELVDVWSDSSSRPPALSKIVVISVSENSVYRRIWEDAFCVELAKHKVAATPSYRLFPDAAPDTNQVIQIIQSNDFDGMLVYHRLPPEMISQSVKGYRMTEQGLRYWRRMEGFALYYRDVWNAGHTDSQKVDIRAIDVWTTKSEGRMMWSATSKTPEPNSVQEVWPEIVKLVMSELTKQKIIASER